ncbi:TPA: hypothetical protein ACS614_001537 [Klebsiella aerogenes]
MLIKKLCIFTLSLFLMYSVDAGAIGGSERIDWYNDAGQIFISKAQYDAPTFNEPMCMGTKVKNCRLFFTSFSVGAPGSPLEGVTILDSASMTDTQYASALAGFSGRKLALPAEGGLCIWMYFKSQGREGFERWNCDPTEGISPIEPVKPTCSILSPVTIDFKEVNASAVNGSIKNSSLNILCNGNATLHVSIRGTSPNSEVNLRTDGSIIAEVLVRNSSGNVGRTEVASANSILMVPINARLKANGTLSGGPFKGSAIINVDIM